MLIYKDLFLVLKFRTRSWLSYPCIRKLNGSLAERSRKTRAPGKKTFISNL